MHYNYDVVSIELSGLYMLNSSLLFGLFITLLSALSVRL